MRVRTWTGGAATELKVACHAMLFSLRRMTVNQTMGFQAPLFVTYFLGKKMNKARLPVQVKQLFTDGRRSYAFHENKNFGKRVISLTVNVS